MGIGVREGIQGVAFGLELGVGEGSSWGEGGGDEGKYRVVRENGGGG